MASLNGRANSIHCYSRSKEWTTLSVDGLVEENIRRRRLLFNALDLLFQKAPGYVAPVNTSKPMATFGCKTPAERRKRLRRLYKVDGRGPWVSHLRIHRRARCLRDYGRRPAQ